MTDKIHNARFWFPAKRYGWGWGAPVTWQGWVVLLGYIVLLPLGGWYFRPRTELIGFLMYAALLTVVFVVIVAFKGEKPLAWRWGKK